MAFVTLLEWGGAIVINYTFLGKSRYKVTAIIFVLKQPRSDRLKKFGSPAYFFV